jgi:hypothetical protein
MARKLIATVIAAAVMSTVVLARASSNAPNLTGTWTGTIAVPENGRRGDKEPFQASFKQDGVELTGTVGPDADKQMAISKGRVESTKFGTLVTFDLVGPSFSLHFELVPSAGVLRGVARLDRDKSTAAVELQINK